MSASDATGRAELVNASVSSEPTLDIGQIVEPVGLEQKRNGALCWGVSH
jgi:hypothetical protein